MGLLLCGIRTLIFKMIGQRPEERLFLRLYAKAGGCSRERKAESEMPELSIRIAAREDLPSIERVYEAAREYMRRSGNPDQWGDGYPQTELLAEDIRNGSLYVLADEREHICGAFMFAVMEDPTYRRIENGTWRDAAPYGVIHRVAGDGSQHGLMRRIVGFCAEQMPHLRMDTHRRNLTMQHQILRNGFTYCGVIHVQDGSERLAYERVGGEAR